MPDIASILHGLSVVAIPVLFAITLHEVAHGWMARSLGDPTAQMEGRLSLNPVRHIDPIGTVALPIGLLILNGPIFGWAKPVPVVFANLRNPRRDMIFVAVAGPGSNLLMAAFWAVLAGLELSVLQIGGNAGRWLLSVCDAGIQINVILAVFNMLPIPPLDGGRVLAGLVPPQAARVLDRIEPFGILIVLVLLLTVLWDWLEPVVDAVQVFFVSIAGMFL